MKHLNDPVCALCEDKLNHVTEILCALVRQVRKDDVTAHICWGHRDEEAQNVAYLSGNSPYKWPLSKHNKKPSLAVDFFKQQNGKAIWDPTWLRIRLESLCKKMGLLWGGNFRDGHKDFPHVETI